MTEIPASLPGNVSLSKHDPVMFDLIEQEKVCEQAIPRLMEQYPGYLMLWGEGNGNEKMTCSLNLSGSWFTNICPVFGDPSPASML